MHPIERLRWIARARDESATSLAVEAAWTISELAGDDPAAVVTACRRLVEAHVTVGPLWWVAASVLAAPDPERAARQAADELVADTTAGLLAEALSGRIGEAPVMAWPAEIVLEALSCRSWAAPRVVAASSGRRAEMRKPGAAAEASHWRFEEAREAVDGASVVLVEAFAAGRAGLLVTPGVDVLVEAARRTSVPIWGVVGAGRMLDGRLLDELSRRAGERAERVEPGLLDAVIGPSGLEAPSEGLGRPLCPPAPELLVRAG